MKIIEAQKLAVEVLRFVLSTGNRKGLKECFAAGMYDNLLLEYTGKALTVCVLAGDCELGFNTYVEVLNDKVAVLEMCDSQGFEGLNLEFRGDTVAVAFNAMSDWGDGKEAIVSTRLKRVNKHRGAFEATIKNFGTVFIDYRLVDRTRKPAGLHINKISASWDPKVTPRSVLRVV